MKRKIIRSNKKYTFLDTILLKYDNNSSGLNVYLKHVLKIIHNFSASNKIIWFVGFDLFIDKNKLNLSSKHIFLPAHFWSNGLIGNRKYVKSKIKTYNFKNPDLVVNFNFNSKTSQITKELIKLDIPIIIFGSSDELSLKSCYVKFVPLKNFEKKLKYFCFSLVYSVLKKR